MGADIGLLEFVAFCNIHKRRLMMLLPDGVIDIVTAFATTLLDETWTPVGDTLHGRSADCDTTC